MILKLRRPTRYTSHAPSRRDLFGSHRSRYIIVCVPNTDCNGCELVLEASYHSFHWHVQNATIPCRFQELLPLSSVMYFFLPPFSTNYSSILSHLILPSISWSTSQPCFYKIHISFPFGNSISFHSLYMPKPT